MKNVNCENTVCLFSIDGSCIKEEITIKDSKNSKYGLCASVCMASEDDVKNLKAELCAAETKKLNEALEQEQFKSKNLEEQVKELKAQLDKITTSEESAELKVDRTADILNKARAKAHSYKSGKGKTLKDLYSNSELEDMYIVQGMSLAAMAEVTDVAKSTLWSRLKSIGAIDRKKAMQENCDLTEKG